MSATPTSTFAVHVRLDGPIAGAPCANDTPASRAYGTGVERAYRTVASAGAAPLAGDAVFIRAGTCNERLAFTQSGARFKSIRRKRSGAGVVRFKP